MADLYKIERKAPRDLLNASKAYHDAFAQEIAASALEVIRADLGSAVDTILSKLALETSTPFSPSKVWFTTSELKKRWNCSDDFLKSLSDSALKPHYLGAGNSMKRYLAIDVYRHEGLITKGEYKKLKTIKAHALQK